VTHIRFSIIISMTAMTLVTSWSDARPASGQRQAASGDGAAGGSAHGAPAATGTTGTVVETMNASSYTYVQVDDGSKKIWAAAPQFAVAVGDKVIVPDGMPMRDFESKALGRKFDLVYFVSAIEVVGHGAGNGKVAAAHGGGEHSMDGAPAGHAAGAHPMIATTPAAPVDLSNIKKADGGQTIAELFANKTTLAGKDVIVRGRVVKYVPAVMGKNWIHIQDGTGGAGTNDLTVTTGATAAVGNTMLVRGKLSTEKDFGFGYKYEVLIEDATIAVE
jgi:hypothetical protein